MNYRNLGSAGIKLSEIGLGGWLTFANALEQEKAKSVMDAAFDVGINFLDTANAYERGRCEEAWGELLKDRRRSSYVLATKVYFPMGEGVNDRGLSRKHIFEQCHASLKRLRTDYIDLYQFHRYTVPGQADPVPVEESVRAVDDLIKQGKILYWGFSEWPADKIEEAVALCENKNYYRPHSSQPQYNALHRAIEEKIMPLCHANGIGQVVYSPLAQGVLSGKYKPGQAPPPDSRAADNRQNKFIGRWMENQDVLAKVQKLIPLSQEAGVTMSQLALAWILRRPEVTSCIIGATRPEQVLENAKASDAKLPPEVFQRMDQILV